MHHHSPIVLAGVSACLVLLGVGCGSGNTGSGTTTSAGGGAGGTAGTSSSGGSATGGSAGGSGGARDAGGGQTGQGGTGGRGTPATGGNAGGGGTAQGGVTGSGGRNGTGGRGTAGSTGRGGSATGSRDGGGGAGSGGTSPSLEGFYKEIFMDVGVGLDHLKGLPSADKLGWAWEFVSTDDVEVQHAYMWGDANDDNGVLLYPDREPRFMMMYTGGGSYVGTCNGNYMAWNWAYKLWPGQIKTDGYEGQVEGVIPDDSPLLKYYDFGGDHLISSGLMHFKGGYETGTLPAGTEVLLRGKSAPDAGTIDGDGQVSEIRHQGLLDTMNGFAG